MGILPRVAMLVLGFCLAAGWPARVEGQAPEGAMPAPAKPSSRPDRPTVFRVKYIGEGSVYIDAGRNADLEEGMKLSVVEAPPDGVIAEGIQYRCLSEARQEVHGTPRSRRRLVSRGTSGALPSIQSQVRFCSCSNLTKYEALTPNPLYPVLK